jgi:hypothetical protein
MDEDPLARMNEGQKRERALEEINASTLDSVGPLGSDEGVKVLSEMNSLADAHDEFVRSLVPRADIL